MEFQIISDGSCDLPQDLVEAKKIEVVPFYVSFDSEDYKKEIVEIGVCDFYQQMVDKEGVYPKTSCPSAQDYYDAFEKYVKQNIPVLCICITVKFSASMQAAMNAKEMILEQYENAQIEIINSEINTVLQGLYVLEACRLRDAGVSFEDTIEKLKSIRSTGRIFFTVGDIEYLKHGGRIGKVAGLAASLLNIKPLITLKEGEIFGSGVARSRKKSMQKVIEMLLDYLEETSANMDEYSLCIGYGYSLEEAQDFCTMVLEALQRYGVTDIPIYHIGATIGVHTGPYPIGLGIIKRVDV